MGFIKFPFLVRVAVQICISRVGSVVKIPHILQGNVGVDAPDSACTRWRWTYARGPDNSNEHNNNASTNGAVDD